MPAPTVVDTVLDVENPPGNTHDVDVSGASFSAGDLIVVFIGTATPGGDADPTDVSDDSTGSYTQRINGYDSINHYDVWTKTAVGDETTITITAAVNTPTEWVGIVFVTDVVVIATISLATASGATVQSSSWTDDLGMALVGWFGNRSGASALSISSPPADMTEEIDSTADPDSTADRRLHVYSLAMSSRASITRTMTWGESDVESLCGGLELRGDVNVTPSPAVATAVAVDPSVDAGAAPINVTPPPAVATAVAVDPIVSAGSPYGTVIAFEPVSQGTFRHLMRWRTDVLVSEDGTEQRVSVGDNPRERLDLGYIVTDEEAAEWRYRLNDDPDDNYEIPVWSEGAPVTAEITGTTVVVDDTYLDWVVDDQRVHVLAPNGIYYESHIVSHVGGTLTLADSPPSTFPAFTTYVYPLAFCFVRDGGRLGWYPVNAAKLNLTALRDEEVTTWGTGASLTTLDSIPIIESDPVVSTMIAEALEAHAVLHDHGGAIQYETPRSRGNLRTQHEWFVDGDADRQWWRLLLSTIRGRQGLFYLSTFRDDLVVHTQPTPSTDQLIVLDDPSYIDRWQGSIAHRQLRLVYDDASVSYHAVIAAMAGAGKETLTLSPDLPGGFTTVDKISFLEQCRLATDDVVLSMEQGSTARISAGVEVVQDPVPRPPLTAIQVERILGRRKTPSYIWDGTETTSPLTDEIASAPLAEVGSPLYGQTDARYPGKSWVSFTGNSSDRFQHASASFLDPGASSSLAIFVHFILPTLPAGNRCILGRRESSSPNLGYRMQVDTAGNITVVAQDSSTAKVATATADHGDNQPHSALMRIDRNANVLQVLTDLASSAGPSLPVGDIAGATDAFGFGRVPAVNAAAVLLGCVIVFESAFAEGLSGADLTTLHQHLVAG